MRTFSKLKSTFYTGSTGRALRTIKPPGEAKDAVLVAGYLVSGPTANQYGLYQLDLETVALHLPCTLAEVRRALEQLELQEFSVYDDDTRWVWVINMAAQQHDVPLRPHDNLVKASKRWYSTLPNNPFLGPFYDRYHTDLRLDYAGERDPAVDRRAFQAPSKGLYRPLISSPSQSPSLVLEGGAGGSDELVLVAPEQKRQIGRHEPAWLEQSFQEFWGLYPRKKGRKDAFDAWRQVAKTEALARTIIERLKSLLPDFDYSNNLTRIKYPQGWLNGERWTDEPSATPQFNQRTEATAKAVMRAGQRGAPK